MRNCSSNKHVTADGKKESTYPFLFQLSEMSLSNLAQGAQALQGRGEVVGPAALLDGRGQAGQVGAGLGQVQDLEKFGGGL